MYCIKCGMTLPNEALFCPKCGADQVGSNVTADHSSSDIAPESSKIVLPRDSGNPQEQSALACSHCRRQDQVQKVASVVGANTSDSLVHVSGSGPATTVGMIGGKTYVGQSLGGSSSTTITRTQSQLAHQLSPPTEPIFQSAWGWGILWGLIAVFVVTLGITILIEDLTGSRGTGSAILLFLWLLSFIAIAIYWVRSKMIENERRRVDFNKSHTRWAKAMNRWQELFYCYRCDGVFVPGNPEFFPIAQISNIVHQK